MNTFNRKKYGSRMAFWSQLSLAVFALFVAAVIVMAGVAQGHALASAVIAGTLVTLVACSLNKPQARMCAVTLSVPEILTDVMDAFKLETPELFQPGGFGTDFSSKTAVLGDKITAKIAKVPLTGDYDANNGGFKAATQDVTTLIEDVPVTLDRFKVVTINITYLTQIASKVALYKEAIRNNGFALGKLIVDTALAQITAANFSNTVSTALANVNLDTFDGDIRNQLNAQKVANRGRFAIINTAMASKLGQDDRVRSSLFYGSLNGDQGYRIWRNLAGFSSIREYPDMFAGANLDGFAGDGRSVAVASRQIDFANAASALGIPEVMKFYPMVDEQSGLSLTGVGWQEAGTGDVYVGCGVLFGIGAGKQGGAAGTITDNAGVRLVHP
jgi:hypothetical protein